jgi:hypothetical protein
MAATACASRTHFPASQADGVLGAARRIFVSLLMLAIVALFPVTLLAILLLTSSLEGKFVSPHPGSSAKNRSRDHRNQRED